MKKLKKLFAAMVAMVMAFAMGVTVYAADITITNGAAGSEYAAYRLLNATDGGEGKFAYTLNDKYAAALKEVTGKTEDKDVINYISGLDADGIRAFADAVFAKIKTLEPEAKTSDDKFSGVDQGYYLIAETKTGDEGDTYSLVMLDTAGNDSVTVTTKEDRPELEKKVKEKNDSTGAESDWQDAADYDIGDNVPFQLTGTVDAKYDKYGSYYYAFHDTMSDGLTFNADSVTVTVDGTAVTTGYEVVTEDLDDGCTFEVRFADLKNIKAVKAGSKVVVNYTAKLNENAVIGEGGNTNVSKLEYSNNPYGDGTGVTLSLIHI